MGLGILDPPIVPLDADDRKDDHSRGLFGTAGAAETHGTSVVGKFQNNTHVAGPAIVRALAAADPSADARTSALSQISRMQG
jgi:hypothetical protein